MMKEIVSLSYSNDIWDEEHVIGSLPALYMSVINSSIEERYLSGYEKCLLRRGLLILCYWHPFIRISEETLIRDLKKTGHGWQRAYFIAKRQQTTIFSYIE